jgi:uncharacterized protein (DUF2461 family)
LAERVVLTKGQFAAAGLWGVAQALLGRRRRAISERADAA